MPLHISTEDDLVEECGFSWDEFRALSTDIANDLQKPENASALIVDHHIGLAYTTWFAGYVTSGIAVRYWGSGSKRKWNLRDHKEK